MLPLYVTIQPLLTSLHHDAQFSVAHANILAVTNVRFSPSPDKLWRYIELLESELKKPPVLDSAHATRNSRAALLSARDPKPLTPILG
eukprot:978080-Amphidinium_carterae.2